MFAPEMLYDMGDVKWVPLGDHPLAIALHTPPWVVLPDPVCN